MWPLYGLLIPKWHFIYDFKNVLRARIASNRFPRPRGADLAQLVGGKVVFFAWAFVLPPIVAGTDRLPDEWAVHQVHTTCSQGCVRWASVR